MKIETKIKKLKEKLINEAQTKGIYENFGQKEVRKLKDKFSYNPYGNEKEKRIVAEIDSFDNWCMNFDDRRLEAEDILEGADSLEEAEEKLEKL